MIFGGGGINLPSLVQKISFDASSSDKAAKEVEGAFAKIGRSSDKVGSALTKSVTIPILGVAAAGAKMAVDVDRSLRQVVTLTGRTGKAAEEQLAKLKDSTAALSNEIGVAQTELTEGLYQAISAGVPEDNAFEFLRTSAEAAVAAGIDTETAIDGLTTTINAFGLSANDAGAVADSMFAAVAGGKTTFGELSDALFNVAPAAAAAGVSFQEVNAAIATLTASGTPTSVATTQIRAALTGLQRPSEALDTIFQSLGYQNAQLAIESQGLGFALDAVSTAAGGSNGKLQELLGGAEAASAAQVLAGTSAGKFADELDRQAESTGYAANALEVMEGSTARSMERLSVSLQNIAISAGEVLIPALERLVGWIQAIVDGFNALPGPAQSVIGWMVGIAAAVGPVLIGVSKLITAFQTVKTALAGLQLGQSAAGFAALGPAVAGVAALAAAGAVIWYQWAKAKAEAADRERALTDALQENTGAVRENIAAAAASFDTTVKNAEALNKAGISLAELTDAASTGTDSFERLQKVARGTGFNVDAMRQAAENADPSVRGLALRLVDAYEAGAISQKEFDGAADAIDEAADAFDDSEKKIRGQADALLENSKLSGELTDEQYQLYRGLLDSASGAQGVQDVLVALEGTLARAGDETGTYADETAALEGASAELEGAQADLEGAVEQVGEQMADSRTEAEKLEDALQELKDAADDLAGNMISAAEAGLRVQDEIDGLRETVKEYGTEIGDRTNPKQRELEGALLDTIDAIFREKDALGDTAEATAGARQKLEQLADEYPGLRTEIDKYIAVLDLVPTDVDTVAQFLTEEGEFDVDAWTAYVEGAQPESVATASVDTSNALRDIAALEIEASESGFEVGEALSEGAAAGITSAARKVADAAAALMGRAVRSAKAAGLIRSPSRLFAVEVGEPITEGIAQGILDAEDEATSAIEQVLAKLEREARDGLDAVLGAIDAGRGGLTADRKLRDAERAVEEAKRGAIQADLDLVASKQGVVEADLAVADAADRLARQKAISREVTAEEQLAIENATDAYHEAVKAYNKGEISAAALEVAHHGLQQAQRESTAATREEEAARRDLEQAQKDLVDANNDVRDAQDKLRDATQQIEDAAWDLEDAQLAVVDAELALIDAGKEWIDAGPEAENTFRRLATEAGLSEDAIDRLITKYGNLATAAATWDRNIPTQPVISVPSGEAAQPTTGGTYTIRAGDSLSRIAAAHGLSLGQLLAKNPSFQANPNLIFPGQTLNLAAGGLALARGGGINANIGEAGRNEAVLPLGSPATVGLMAQAVGVPVAEAVARQVGSQLARDILGIDFGKMRPIDVAVYNPVPETAAGSTSRRLRALSDAGMF